MAEIVPLTLAREELVYALRALDIATLPGLENPPLVPMPPDEEAMVMAVADRTMRAHQLAIWKSDSERELAPWVAAILQRCARASRCLLVQLHQPASPSFTALFAVNDADITMHWMPESGTHLFLAFSDIQAWLLYLSQTLKLDEMAVGIQERFRFERESVLAAMEDDIDSLRTMLAQKMVIDAAFALAEALKRPARRVEVALYPGDPASSKP